MFLFFLAFACAQVNVINANYVEVTTTTMLQVGSNTITAPGGLAFAINPPGTLLLTASLGGTTGWTTSAVFDVVLMSEPNWQTFKAGGILGVTTVLQSGVSSVAMMSIPVQQQSPPGKYYVVLDNGFGFGTMPPFGSSLTVIWGFLFTPTGGGGATTPTTTIVTTAPATTTTTIVNTPPATTTTTTTTTTIVTTAPPTPVAPTTAKGPTPGVPRCPAQLGGTPQGTNCNIIRNVETCTYYCNNRMCTVSLPNGSQTDTLMCDGTTGAGTQPPSTTRAPTPAATSLTTNVPFTPPPTTPQRTTDQFITPAPTPMQPTPSYTTPPTIGIPTDPPPTPIGGVFTFAPTPTRSPTTLATIGVTDEQTTDTTGDGGSVGQCSEENLMVCKGALSSKCSDPICECDANGDLSLSACPNVSVAPSLDRLAASLIVGSALLILAL